VLDTRVCRVTYPLRFCFVQRVGNSLLRFKQPRMMRLPGGWDRLLNWLAHPLAFGFSKVAVFPHVSR